MVGSNNDHLLISIIPSPRTESVSIPQDLLGAWPECSLVVPDMRKRGLEELLARLFNHSVAPMSKKSVSDIRETVEFLHIPLEVGSLDQGSASGVRVLTFNIVDRPAK